MQNKHLGALSVSFLTLSILVSVFVFRDAVSSTAETKPVPNTAADKLTVNQQQLEAIIRLLPEIGKLAQMLELPKQSVDMKAFGSEPAVATPRKSRTTPRFNYRVSMVYLSTDQKYCVVNDEFHSVGDKLSDGGIVKAISEKGALIRKGGVSRWIAVSHPVATSKSRRDQNLQHHTSQGLTKSIEALEYLRKLQEELKERK